LTFSSDTQYLEHIVTIYNDYLSILKLIYPTKFFTNQGIKMSRKCAISGKGPMSGNNVSHAHNKTKRRFLPNLRVVRIKQEDGTTKKIRISAKELRTMRKNG